MLFRVTACTMVLSISHAALAQSVSFVVVSDETTEARGWGLAPALHNGTVSFLAEWDDPKWGWVRDGIALTPDDGSQVYTTVFRDGDPIPNNPEGRTFSTIDNPSVFNGQAAASGGWATDRHDGIYMGDGGPLNILVDRYADGIIPRFAFLDANGVGFTDDGNAYEPPYYKPHNGSAFPLALYGWAAPGGGSFVDFGSQRGPSLGGGFAAFQAIVSHSTAADYGCYGYDLNARELKLVANWNNTVPLDGRPFEHFGTCDTDGESVVFTAGVDSPWFGGVNGIYLTSVDNNGQQDFTVIAQSGQPSPIDGHPWLTTGIAAVQDGLVVFDCGIDAPDGYIWGLFGWYKGRVFPIVTDDQPFLGHSVYDFRLDPRGLDGRKIAFRYRYGGSCCNIMMVVATIDLSDATLSVTGTCPGTITATVTDTTPGERVAFVVAREPGNYTVPSGQPCAGTVLSLSAPVQLIDSVVADENGIASVSGLIPPAACGRVLIQAIDVATCTPTNVVGL